MNKMTILAMILGLSMAIVGCTQDSSDSSDRKSVSLSELSENEAATQEVTLSYRFTALQQSDSACSSCRLDVAEGPVSIEGALDANLYVEDTQSGNDFDFDWIISLSEDFEAQSFLTIALPVTDFDNGTEYEFILEAEDSEGRLYRGEAIYQLSHNEQATIDLTIRPVIGDLEVTAELSEEITLFQFSYPGVETLAFDGDTFLLFYVDGDRPIRFDLLGDSFFDNADTSGEGGFFYSFGSFDPDTAVGPHDLRVELFDGGILRAHGEAFQLFFDPEDDLLLDLNPLHGEVAFSLTSESDSFVRIAFPEIVFDEAGFDNEATSELSLTFQMVGPLTNFSRTISGEELSGPDSNDNYFVEFPQEVFEPDTVAWSLVFDDAGNGDRIAWCAQNDQVVALSQDDLILSCDLTLRRRNVITGVTWAVLGINAVAAFNNFPIEGAEVSIVDLDEDETPQLIGLTGSGSNGTDTSIDADFLSTSYLKIPVKLGHSYDILVDYNGETQGTASLEPITLFGLHEDEFIDKLVDNIVIKLLGCPFPFILDETGECVPDEDLER